VFKNSLFESENLVGKIANGICVKNLSYLKVYEIKNLFSQILPNERESHITFWKVSFFLRAVLN